MSREFMSSVKCPNCEKEYPFQAWDSINTVINPELKEKVKDRSIFTFCCPNCNTSAIINYNCLYHQMDDHRVIYVVHSLEDEAAVYSLFKDDFFAFQEEELYTKRIVSSWAELLEKISIFDDNLDDKIIEFYKSIILENLDNEEENDIAIFYCGGPDPHFEVYFNDTFKTVSFDRNIYNDLVTDTKEFIDEIFLNEFVINYLDIEY